MGYGRNSYDRAGSAVADECFNGNGDADNKRLITRFDELHLNLFREDLVLDGGLSVDDAHEMIVAYAQAGIAYTGFYGDKIIMIGGAVFNVAPGVAETWSVRTKYAGKYPVLLTRGFRMAIKESFSMGMHRVQCTVKEDFVASIEWHKRAGMVIEGMRNHFTSDGSNYVELATWVGQHG